ncbi:cytochrome c oxidase subunit 3 [Rubrolithibacter danxiaensis]|uniref:cytochrome c oxidase subunit 3 n=1 Tax=Rubrolithibacter danxiaensis TaxID=3390805 RepID=UPI003BF86886
MENKLMMKLVIATEAIFFLSLMITFVYFAIRPGFKQHSLDLLDIKTTGIFSLMLFSSSFTFWRAEVNFNRGQTARLKTWLGVTIFLGIIFLFGQIKEYLRLLHEDFTISKDIFGTSFFTLTAFHGLHVFIGLIILSVVLLLAIVGDFDKPGSSVIKSTGMYWHFVDLVWLLVFSLVYILPLMLNKTL